MQQLCLALSIVFLLMAIAAVILYSAWVEDGSPLRSLTTVRGIRAQPLLLSMVLRDPQSLPVIYHGDHTAGGDLVTYALLVLVESPPDAYAHRMAIRRTWMMYPSVGVSVAVLFTITEKDLPVHVLVELSQESARYRDMVVFRGIASSLGSECLLYQLLWADHNIQYKHLLRTRDSFYVRVEELLHDIRRVQRNVYWGYFAGRQQPGEGTKAPEPEWFVCNSFVRFAHSGGYVISRPLVGRLLAQAEYLQLYNNEDVAVGLWLTPYSDVKWRHDPRFDTEVGASRGCRNDYLVLPVNNALAMVELHRWVLESGRLCVTEFEHIQSYSFDFESPVDQCCSPA